MTRQSRGIYASLIPLIREITQAPMGALNRLSGDSIQGLMDSGRLFSVKPRVSYDRSNVADWTVVEEPVADVVRPVTRSTAAAAAIAERDAQPRRPRAGAFSGGKSRSQRKYKKHSTKKRRRY